MRTKRIAPVPVRVDPPTPGWAWYVLFWVLVAAPFAGLLAYAFGSTR